MRKKPMTASAWRKSAPPPRRSRTASCEKEADDRISLEEVRAATAKIKDSMARVVIEEERAERF
jgi:hypothetical protein